MRKKKIEWLKKIAQVKKLSQEAGFSLMEILIAITLLAIAGTFVVGKLMDRLDEGKVNSAKIQIGNFRGLLDDYRRYCNQYPTTDQGLAALKEKPSVAPECSNYPASGFLDSAKIPDDPWGRPYMYESDGSKYLITTFGRDGKAEGKDYDADIKSTDL